MKLKSDAVAVVTLEPKIMQALIFDIDGTLLHSSAEDDRLYRLAVEQVLALETGADAPASESLREVLEKPVAMLASSPTELALARASISSRIPSASLIRRSFSPSLRLIASSMIPMDRLIRDSISPSLRAMAARRSRSATWSFSRPYAPLRTRFTVEM